MSAFIPIVGFRFGKLTVLAEAAPQRSNANGRRYYFSVCLCECGNTKTIKNEDLRSGVKSCGCSKKRGNPKHGHATCHITRTYKAWSSMKQRCLSPNSSSYARYGGAGITVCKPWQDSFKQFLTDMGECPPGLEIDRWPDQKGNYEPGNTRWATPKQQARNMSTNFVVTFRGITASLAELCDVFGVVYNRTYNRIRRGWDIERAFCTPTDPRKQR